MTENGKPSKPKTVHTRADNSVPSSADPKTGHFAEQASEFIEEPSENGSRPDDFPVQDRKWEARERAKRLREAAGLVGGGRAISERSGVPYTTLNAYLGGGEMKVSNAIALAEAAGVRLEWLLTGAGPMRVGEPLPADGRPSPDMDDIDQGNLIWALAFVESQFGRDAPAEKRVRAMLSTAQEFRRAHRLPPLPYFHPEALADGLQLVEYIDMMPRRLGRPMSDAVRIKRMLGAYQLLMEDDEAEEKPAS